MSKSKKSTAVKSLELILERESKGDNLWGRIAYRDDLIVDFGKNLEEVEGKMYRHISDRYQLTADAVEFETFYDLTALFKEKSFLNLSSIAERAGINRSVMAQYAAGIKYPSMERAVIIQEVIHGIGNELLAVNLAVKSKPVNGYFFDVRDYAITGKDTTQLSVKQYKAIKAQLANKKIKMAPLIAPVTTKEPSKK